MSVYFPQSIVHIIPISLLSIRYPVLYISPLYIMQHIYQLSKLNFLYGYIYHTHPYSYKMQLCFNIIYWLPSNLIPILYQQIRNNNTVPYPDILIYHLTEYTYIYIYSCKAYDTSAVGRATDVSLSELPDITLIHAKTLSQTLDKSHNDNAYACGNIPKIISPL